MRTTAVLPSTLLAVSAAATKLDFVAQYTPYTLTVYASTSRYRFGRKTRYEASG